MSDRMTAADFNAATAKAAKKSKYGSKSTVVDGVRFDSKREAKRWAELCILLAKGEIANLERQVKIPLLGRDDIIKTPGGRQSYYVADFTYTDLTLNGVHVIEDSKGMETDVFKLKRAILKASGKEVKTS